MVQLCMDWERARDANYRYRAQRHHRVIHSEAEMRAIDPEYDRKRARIRRALGFRRGQVHSLADPSEQMTIPSEDEWARMREETRVEVRMPDFSRTTSMRAAGSGPSSHGGRVVNSHVSSARLRDCHGSHRKEALALLSPRCFFHGWDVLEERRTEISTLGRPAEIVPMRRIIPLSDPRIMGDEMNPTVFGETEDAEIVVDREHGVILEWRALFEGNVYERHFFSEIAFDVPVERSEFEIKGHG